MMRISERKFLSYLDVQTSGECHMDDPKAVVKLAGRMNQVVLQEEDVRYIRSHFERLCRCYGIGFNPTNIKSFK